MKFNSLSQVTSHELRTVPAIQKHVLKLGPVVVYKQHSHLHCQAQILFAMWFLHMFGCPFSCIAVES